MTGVCLLSADQRICFCDVSDVEFYPLTTEEIEAYVATGEPLDKAGAVSYTHLDVYKRQGYRHAPHRHGES